MKAPDESQQPINTHRGAEEVWSLLSQQEGSQNKVQAQRSNRSSAAPADLEKKRSDFSFEIFTIRLKNNNNNNTQTNKIRSTNKKLLQMLNIQH